MLPVSFRIDQLKLNHMFSIINGLSPEYMKCDISCVSNSGYNTRSGNRSCVIPRVKSFGIRSFFYTAIKLWNSLPPNIQALNGKFVFKLHVKQFLWDKLHREEQQPFLFY